MSSRPHVLYEHRQTAWPLLGFACVPLVTLAVILLRASPSQHTPPAGPMVAIGLMTLVLPVGFGSLSLAVTRDRLSARFGVGLVRRSVDLDDVLAVEIVKTRWYQGWGIHRTRRGTLYNAAGFDAVRVTRRNGRPVIVGSDDAVRLVSVLRHAIDDRRRARRRGG